MLLTDDEQVRQLNQTYRGKDVTTDVLSFGLDTDDPAPTALPQPEIPGGGDGPPRVLGDVVVSLEQAARQAPSGNLEAELVRLLVHGVCHLCGHDHGTRTEAKRMQREEERLLALFGLDRGLIARSR